jgi:hypothetical protein
MDVSSVYVGKIKKERERGIKKEREREGGSKLKGGGMT